MRSEEISVEVKDLVVKFGDFFAVDHISFTVRKGEIFGFLGANGAGKTTTIRVLCGLIVPTAGVARVCGLGFEDGGNAIKSKVGYMSQRFTLYDDLTIEENLSFSGSLRKIEPKKLKERRDYLLNFVGFNRDLKTFVRDLPGGIRQQISLAAALIHDPEIVFLDEPTAGVTPAARQKFWELIRNLSAGGKTVFVTTHYMDEAEQCERIALMRSGKIIALDSPEGLKERSYPEPLFELDPISADALSTAHLLEGHPSLADVQVHGMRLHAAVRDLTAWEKELPGLEKQFRIKRIRPSLEDVFIRLVEGTRR